MAAMAALWLVGVLFIGFNLGDVVGFISLWTYLGGVLMWRQWRIRRAVHAIRSLTHENRLAALSSIGCDPVRMFLELELRDHGEAEVGGVVERFHVSPVDQREAENLAYGVLSGAVIGASLPLAVEMTATIRLALWVASSVACVASWCLLARARWYRRSYEVSAFSLKAVAPGSESHALPWSGGVVIVNRPRLKRIEFRSTDGSVSIRIPYRVVGFERLIEVLAGHLKIDSTAPNALGSR